MTMTLAEWEKDVSGRFIGSGQCVALVNDYCSRVLGLPLISTNGGRKPGYAGSMWDNPTSGYVKRGATEVAGAGWIAVWGTGPFTPATHTAVTVGDAIAGVSCMTQNPGPAHVEVIPKLGLLGYYAPASNPGSGSIVTVGDTNPITEGIKTVEGLNAIKNWVSDAGNWRRIGLYALGIVILAIAMLYLFRNDTMKLVKEVI